MLIVLGFGLNEVVVGSFLRGVRSFQFSGVAWLWTFDVLRV